MFTLSEIFETLLKPFCQLFSAQIWLHTQVLIVKATLSPASGKVGKISQPSSRMQQFMDVLQKQTLSPAECPIVRIQC